MLRCLRGLVFLCGVFWALGAARAEVVESSGRFVREHLAFEVSAVGGFRSAWADERNPGFHLAGGGAEVNIGLELENGLGFLIGGRALFAQHLGEAHALDGTYAEASGQALMQLRVSEWVRIGLGATTGQLFRCCSAEVKSPATSALLYGGFLRVGVDFLPRLTLPRAFSLWLRLDVNGQRPEDEMTLLPAVTMNMTVAIGMRL